MAALLSRRATLAAPIFSGRVPRLLDKTTRTRDPPTEICAIWRSVWSLKCNGDAPLIGSSRLGVASRTAAGTSFDQGKACAVLESVWAG